MRVDGEAAQRILQRGGRLFLWQRPVGRAWLQDCLAIGTPPPDVRFHCEQDLRAGVEVCIAEDVEASEIVVRARRRPLRGVRVYVDGKPWGTRGDVGGAG